MKVNKGRILSTIQRKPDILESSVKIKTCFLKNEQSLYKNCTKPDPRPIYDRNYISFCIREIKLFLNQSGYRNYIKHKISVPLKNKVFFKIIYFLFKKLDRNFKVQSNPENDIPYILKLLGYPVSLAKRSLASTTNLQFSPILINCLNWIVELCLYDLKTIFENKTPYKRNLNNNFLWKRMVKSYTKFLSKNRITDNLKIIVKIVMKNYFNLKEKQRKMKENLSIRLEKFSFFFKKIFYIYLIFQKKLKLLSHVKKNYRDSKLILIYKYRNVIKNSETKLRLELIEKIIMKNSTYFGKKEKIDNNLIVLKKIFFIKLINAFFMIVFKIINLKNFFRWNTKIKLKIINLAINTLFFERENIKPSLLFRMKVMVLNLFGNLSEKIYLRNDKIFHFSGTSEIFCIIHHIYKVKIKYFSELFNLTNFVLYKSQKNFLNFQNTFENKRALLKIYIKMKNEKIEKDNDIFWINLEDVKKNNVKYDYLARKKFFGSFKLKRLIHLYCIKKLINKLVTIFKKILVLIIKIKKKDILLNFYLLKYFRIVW